MPGTQLERGARRVPRRAPAAEGRVRQLPQAGRARAARRWSRARRERLVKELLPVARRPRAGARRRRAARGGEARGRRPARPPRARRRARASRASRRSRPTGAFDPHVHEALLSQPSEDAERLRGRGAAEGLPARRPRAAAGPGGRRVRADGATMASDAKTSTRRSASRRTPRRTRSRRRTASSRASTTRTRTRATRRPRSGSRRCRTPTTSSPTRRSASSTTASARRTAAGPGGGFNWNATSATSTSATSATSSAGSSAAAASAQQRAAARPARQRRRGRRCSLSFEDALKGVETKIPVELELACHTCHGTGAKPGTAPIICPECNGRGVVAESQGFFALSQPCPRCRGNGTIIEEPCPTCHGSGRERRTKRYTVKIPAGRQGRHADPAEGQGRGRLGRRARPATSSSSRGSSRRRSYERRGDDLVVEVPVAFADAALGTKVAGADARRRRSR